MPQLLQWRLKHDISAPSLLKVDIDPAPHRGAIHKVLAPDGATGMDLMQFINGIWMDRPNERHLHVYVRLPSAILRKHSASEPEDIFSYLKLSLKHRHPLQG